MSRTNGQMRTCERCGAWVFLKCTGEGEMDGGFTCWNKFELATGWSVIDGVGDVRPRCREDYAAVLEQYNAMLEQYKKKPPEVRRD